MIKNYIVGLWLGLLVVIINVCAQEEVVFTDPGKPIVVKRSQPVFDIILQSNPTTGFSWALKNYDANLILPLKNKFYAPPSQCFSDGRGCKTGVPGYEKWSFKIKPEGFTGTQPTDITLIYRRPWEKSLSSDVQEINFKVVTNNAN